MHLRFTADRVALVQVFVTQSWTVSVIPALCILATGSVVNEHTFEDCNLILSLRAASRDVMWVPSTATGVWSRSVNSTCGWDWELVELYFSPPMLSRRGELPYVCVALLQHLWFSRCRTKSRVCVGRSFNRRHFASLRCELWHLTPRLEVHELWLSLGWLWPADEVQFGVHCQVIAERVRPPVVTSYQRPNG
jgi:hypothetical protein